MKRGFTLVELLVVIAILAILSTLGVTNFQSARIKARDLARKSDLQTIAKSLETYINDHRSYPLSSNSKIVCQSPATCDWGEAFTDGTTTYIIALPQESSSSFYYRYESASGTDYTLYAHLENPNDPDLVTLTGISCGDLDCNYKLTSSNIQ